MSSTSKTPNYDLSQFTGTDKPAWLTDYNQDMSKIDGGIKTAADTATAADGKADANTTNIGELTYLSTTAKNNLVAAVNEVDGKSSTAQNTANTAIQGVTTANQAINDLASKFNLNTHLQYRFDDITFAEGTGSKPSGTDPVLFLDHNNDGTVFKLYGTMIFTPTSTNVKLRIPNTGISTPSSYLIDGVGITYPNGNEIMNILNTSIIVNDNSIDITLKYLVPGKQHVSRLFACLYFNTDFGNIVPSN